MKKTKKRPKPRQRVQAHQDLTFDDSLVAHATMPLVESGLNEMETKRRLAFEEAERRARYARWDEIEEMTHRVGLRKPAARPTVEWPEPAWSYTQTPPREPAAQPAPAATTTDEQTIVLPEPAVVTKPSGRRSQLVMRLEAANKMAFATASAEAAREPYNALFDGLEDEI